MGFNIFKKLRKRNTSATETLPIQAEYIDALTIIMTSPSWNKDLAILHKHLPADVSDETIQYVYQKYFG